jgi:hypothetical protein
LSNLDFTPGGCQQSCDNIFKVYFGTEPNDCHKGVSSLNILNTICSCELQRHILDSTHSLNSNLDKHYSASTSFFDDSTNKRMVQRPPTGGC